MPVPPDVSWLWAYISRGRCDKYFEPDFRRKSNYGKRFEVVYGYTSQRRFLTVFLAVPASQVPGLTLTKDRMIWKASDQVSYNVGLRRVRGPTGTAMVQGEWAYFKPDAAGRLVAQRQVRAIAAIGTKPFDELGALPSNVTDSDVQRVRDAYARAWDGELDQTQLGAELDDISARIGKDALAWIVRNLPLYDAQTSTWQSFNGYAKNLGKESGVPSDSRLGRDPVGTAVDLMYGNPSPDEILDWLGFGK